MSDSSTKFERPLRLELDASRRLAALAGLAHLVAAGACLRAALPAPLAGWLLAAIALHYLRFLRLYAALLPGPAVDGIAWDAHHGWRLRVGGGAWQAARLRTPFFVTFPLAVVRFRLAPRKLRTAVILADRLSVDDFRRLRVRLLQTPSTPPG